MDENTIEIQTEIDPKSEAKVKSFFQYLSEGVQNFKSWLNDMVTIDNVIEITQKAINMVMELDAALVDLKKTSKMTDRELSDFYLAANDTAKQMGVTTKEILQQAVA